MFWLEVVDRVKAEWQGNKIFNSVSRQIKERLLIKENKQ